ncbi:histone H1-like [Hypanus sabinus]|uniref:histone H1-like n=1 Tax=Hypanus sabinus TaxID=79690 RepID=UPI0028C48E21|nr:histone H1-like [Hypanus sabinus]XP_059826946.1 histone H1-like [Hypanus sabinus]
MTDLVRTKRTRKKTKAPQVPKNESVSKMIIHAVADTKERRGLSLAGVKKVLSGSGYDVTKNNSRIIQAVRTMVNKGSLVNVTGKGASGSFKLSKEQKDQVERAEKKGVASRTSAVKTSMGKRAAKRPIPAKKPKKTYRGMKKFGGRKKWAKDGRKPKTVSRRKAVRKVKKTSRQRPKPRKPTKRPAKAEKPLTETSSSEKVDSEQHQNT